MEAVNNKLFVLGGYTDGPDTMSFDDCHTNEVYDIELDQWSKVKDIPIEMGHWFGSSTVQNDTIYILGGVGSSPTRTLHSYNYKEDEIPEGTLCGECIQKVVSLKVPVPNHLLLEMQAEEVEEN